MYLKHLSLQDFRSYTKSQFNFSHGITVIVGPNTAGKTNIIEAIYLLASGRSFRADKDLEMIRFNQEIARVSGKVAETGLEVILTTGQVGGVDAPFKKFLVNGVSKRRVDFSIHLPTVLFAPIDLDMIVGPPGLRREFLNNTLEQADKTYSLSLIAYGKALRQRNALLERMQETGVRHEKQFEYWDTLLIEHGQNITQKREAFIQFLNRTKKNIFNFTLFYDKSTISKERLLQYKAAEVGSGVTLVGPHRDDFSIRMGANDVKKFGSRGQQRLVVLELKLLQLLFIEQALKQQPLLLLDDIFSELDDSHIALVSEIIGKQQTILTTTHQEFIGKSLKKDAVMIELKL